MPLLSKLPLPLVRLAFASAVLAITVLALMPASNVPMTTAWDQLDHGLAFFTLALLGEPAFPICANLSGVSHMLLIPKA